MIHGIYFDLRGGSRKFAPTQQTFSHFIPEFTRLMNGLGYTGDQAKIDLLSVSLSDEMNQLLIRQDMPADYLGYVTWLTNWTLMSVWQVSERICKQVVDQILLFEEIQPVQTIPLLIPNLNHLRLMPSVVNLLSLPKLQLSVRLSQYHQLYKPSQP